MAAKPVSLAFHILLGLLYYTALGDKVAQKIYRDLKSVAPCVVLTNATHQIGCTSSMNGHVGVVHYVRQKSDVDWILGSGRKHAPYIPIFRSDQFDVELLDALVNAKMISGALVIAVESGKHRYVPSSGGKGFSPDTSCPNDGFGMYDENSEYGHCKEMMWNKNGNAMSFSYHDIPIIALFNETEVDYILQCFSKYNNQTEPEYPLCGAELKDFMFAAKDTPTCMRKTNMKNPIGSEFCQPLGDTNVWGTLYHIKEPLKEKDVVMLATKVDSSSYFHDLAPGVDNDGTGIVVALAVANALGELKRNGSFPAPKRPIMFTFFQGESWDYIGSSRMVYDMEKGKFPRDWESWQVKGEPFTMNTSHIKYFMELNQVGLLESDTLWAHSDPVSRKIESTDKEARKMLKIVRDAGNKQGMSVGDPSKDAWQPLPPASFQRFLKSNPTIPGLVLTDHKGEYVNKYYNSRFDDVYQAGGNVSRENDTIYLITDLTKKLTKVASTVATALVALANDEETPTTEIKVEDAVVGHLAFCLFNRSTCPLYKEVYDEKQFEHISKYQSQMLSRYIGVNSTINPFTTTVFHVLLYFLGYHLPSTDECSSSEGVSAIKVQGRTKDGICVKGSVHLSPAVSPAFELKQYASTEYSTWAESTWGAISVRIFLIASPRLELIKSPMVDLDLTKHPQDLKRVTRVHSLSRLIISQVPYILVAARRLNTGTYFPAVTLASGFIITLFSFLVVYFVHKKADAIFIPDDPLTTDLNG